MRKFTIHNSQLTIKILVFSLLLSIVHLQFSIPVYAQTVDIGYSKLHPASAFYFLKATRENLEMKLAQTTRVKNLRQLEFATRRLREVKTLIPINQDLIPPTLERYIAHLNSLTDKHQKNDEFMPILRDTLVTHLQVLRQIYDQSSSLRAKIFIRSAMNRIIQRADVPNFARVPVCSFFQKEASSSALNQTEQAVYKSRAQSCLNSLKVVPGF